MLRVVCLRAGGAYPPAYVSILYDMVRRNLAEGFEGDFVCFTDQPDKFEGVTIRPLPEGLPGWWGKLSLFKRGVFPDGDRVLYFDLDTVITGRLDELAGYSGPFAILRDFYRPDGLQSAVMAWTAGECCEIWESFTQAGCPMDDPQGDQAWIEKIKPDAIRLQDKFPGLFVSYKQIKGAPAKASVVCFHGRPKPHEVDCWVKDVWAIGGMTRAELDSVCNTTEEKIRENVRQSCALDLRWFDLADEHQSHVCIVGGGPSLAEKFDELRWRQKQGHIIWALNGAGRFLYRNGICPNAVIIADARAENEEFLSDLHAGTPVYLASQCHPNLFKAAREYELEIVLWHANTPGMDVLLNGIESHPVHLIGGGSTVGLNAMVLAFAEGYRKLHLFGFDSSYRAGEHHAYAQAGNDKDRVIDAIYAGQRFKTCAWMAQQVNEFKELSAALVGDGCLITVAGDGLLPAVARDMAKSIPATPAQVRADQILKRFAGLTHGAEIGVFKGDMSAALLRGNDQLLLDMVDSWEGDGAAYAGESGDWHAELTQDMQNGFFEAAVQRTNFAKDRRTIRRGRSAEIAKQVPDGHFDFVFIDADHSYAGCCADILAWAPKIKPGGWLCGHDYENTAFPKFGVTEAVKGYAETSGLNVELGENFCWFIQMPNATGEKVYGLKRH